MTIQILFSNEKCILLSVLNKKNQDINNTIQPLQLKPGEKAANILRSFFYCIKLFYFSSPCSDSEEEELCFFLD